MAARNRKYSNSILKYVVQTVAKDEETLKQSIEIGAKTIPGDNNSFLNLTHYETLFKSSSNVIKMVSVKAKKIQYLVAICLDGVVMGLPIKSAVGRISWKSQIQRPPTLDTVPHSFAIFSVVYDSINDCFYIVLMMPHGDKGVFWVGLRDLIISSKGSDGSYLQQLIDHVPNESAKFTPKVFLGLAMDERNFLYSCHGDFPDVTVWDVDFVDEKPKATLTRIIETTTIPGISPDFKAAFCAVFTQPCDDNSGVRQRLLALGNMWDSSVFVLITKGDQVLASDMENENDDVDGDSSSVSVPATPHFTDQVMVAMCAAEANETPRNRPLVDKPRDISFDRFGHLYIVDHENFNIKIMKFKPVVERLWTSQCLWQSPRLHSQPLSCVAMVKESKGKLTPLIYAGLFNNDVALFH